MVCIEFNNIVAHVLDDHSRLQWQGNRSIASTDDEIPVDSVERPGRDRYWCHEGSDWLWALPCESRHQDQRFHS